MAPWRVFVKDHFPQKKKRVLKRRVDLEKTHMFFLWGKYILSDAPRIFRRWSEVTTSSDMLLHWRYPNVEIPSCWMSADVSVKRKEYLHLINSSTNFLFRWILQRLRGFILFCQQLRLSIADSNWIFHGWHWTIPSLTDDMIAIFMPCYPKWKHTNQKHCIWSMELVITVLFLYVWFRSNLMRLLLSPIPVLGPLLPELFFLACCGVTWQNGGMERWWDGRFKKALWGSRGMDLVFPPYQLHMIPIAIKRVDSESSNSSPRR